MALNTVMASLSLGAGSQQPVTLRNFEGFRAAGAARPAQLVTARSRQAAAQRTPLRIQAARVGGVEIPNKKMIEFSLQYVYGIGHTTAKAILSETGIANKRTYELSEEELTSLRDEVEKYSIEGDLRRFQRAQRQAPQGHPVLPRPAPHRGARPAPAAASRESSWCVRARWRAAVPGTLSYSPHGHRAAAARGSLCAQDRRTGFMQGMSPARARCTGRMPAPLCQARLPRR